MADKMDHHSTEKISKIVINYMREKGWLEVKSSEISIDTLESCKGIDIRLNDEVRIFELNLKDVKFIGYNSSVFKNRIFIYSDILTTAVYHGLLRIEIGISDIKDMPWEELDISELINAINPEVYVTYVSFSYYNDRIVRFSEDNFGLLTKGVR